MQRMKIYSIFMQFKYYLCNSMQFIALQETKQINSITLHLIDFSGVKQNSVWLRAIQFGFLPFNQCNTMKINAFYCTEMDNAIELQTIECNALLFHSMNATHCKSMVFNSVRNNSVKFNAHQLSSMKKNIY